MTEQELRTAELIRKQITELEKLETILHGASADRRIGIQIHVDGNNYGYYYEQSRRMREMSLRLVKRLLKSKEHALCRMVGEDVVINEGIYTKRDWQFMRVTLPGSAHNMTECNLRYCLINDNIDGLKLYDCVADNLRCTYINSQAAQISNVWAERSSFKGCYIKNRLIDESTFVECDFSGAYLRGIVTESSNFSGCKFDGASMQGSNLSGAELGETTWTGANLNGTAISSQYQELIESFEYIGKPIWV
jgi:hypothetical protein